MPEGVNKLVNNIVGIVLGPLLVLVPGWLLIIKFQFFQAPGLMKYFPDLYIFLFVCIAVGIGVTIISAVRLLKK